MGGWTPVVTGDRMEAKAHLTCKKKKKNRGKWVTWASRKEK